MKRFTVSFLLVFALLIPSTFAEDVYSFDPPVDYDTMADVLFSSDSGIMPLDFASTDSTNLRLIAERLIYGGSSAASWLSTINSNLRYNNVSVASLVSSLLSELKLVDNALSIGGYSVASLQQSANTSLINLYNRLGDVLTASQRIGNAIYGNNNVPSSNTNLNSNMVNGINAILKQMQTAGGSESTFTGSLTDSDGNLVSWTSASQARLLAILIDQLATQGNRLFSAQQFTGSVWVSPFYTKEGTYSQAELIAKLGNTLVETLYLPSGPYLDMGGNVGELSGPVRFVTHIRNGFMGLSSNIAGSDKLTAFSFLSEDIKSSESVEVNNVLDAIGTMGTNLQNPLQRLAYVFANPQDLEMRENVSEEMDGINDNFLKPGSAGKVDKDDIGSAAGLVTGGSDIVSSDGSVSGMFGAMTDSSGVGFGFFSQAVKDDLSAGLDAPATIGIDDLPEPDENGFYNFYDAHLRDIYKSIGKEDAG